MNMNRPRVRNESYALLFGVGVQVYSVVIDICPRNLVVIYYAYLTTLSDAAGVRWLGAV